MPDFGNPFSGMNADRKLNKEELIRALRFSIAAEYEAIQLYEQLADSITDKHAQEVLRDIANEELVHVGEFMELVKRLNPEEEKFYQEGAKETREMKRAQNQYQPMSFNEFIVKHTQILMEDPSADDHFPPQRGQMLYEMYRELLRRGDPNVIKYHKDLMKMDTDSPDCGQNRNDQWTKGSPKRVVQAFLDRESFTWVEPPPRTRIRERIRPRLDRPGIPGEKKPKPEDFAAEGEAVEVFEGGNWRKKPFKKTMAPLVEKGQIRKY